MDLLLAGMSEDDLKRELRLKWIPTSDGFDFKNVADYEGFLTMPHEDQMAFLDGLNDDDYQLYETLVISNACYREPERPRWE